PAGGGGGPFAPGGVGSPGGPGSHVAHAPLLGARPPEALTVPHGGNRVKDETSRDAFERDLSAAASSLRKSCDSPELWPRIGRALLLESSRKASAAPEKVGFFEDLFGSLAANWRPALAGLALFGLATAGLLVFRGSGGRDPFTVSSSHAALLTEQAASE